MADMFIPGKLHVVYRVHGGAEAAVHATWKYMQDLPSEHTKLVLRTPSILFTVIRYWKLFET